MYITIFYLFVLAIFISAIGGFMFYKILCKIFQLSKSLNYILGGIASLILSYPITKLLLFGGVWYFHLPIAELAVILYVIFLIMSNKGSKKN